MQPNIIFGAYMPTPTPAHAVQLLVPLPVNTNNEMGTDYQVTAPPINQGGLTQGSAITLTGTGFGARNNQTQELYDNFDGSTVGDKVQGNNANYPDPDFADYRYAYFSDVSRSVNSNRSIALHHYNDGDGTKYDPIIVSRKITGVEASGKTFFHWRMKHKWPDPTGLISSNYQFKLGTMAQSIDAGGHTTAGIDTQLSSVMYRGTDDPYDPYTKISYRSHTDEDTAESLYYPDNAIPKDNDSWIHHYQMVDHGTVGVADGAMECNLGVNGNYFKKLNIADKNYLVRSVDEYFKQFKLAWYIALLPEWDITVYFDEVCQDSSFKQVWLADATTREAASNLELQPLTSWSDLEVGFSLNLGSFASAVDKYFLVQDDDGLVSHVIPANDLIGA